MILDANLLLSGSISSAGVLSGQSITGSSPVLSANTLDIGPLALGGNQVADEGAGEGIRLEFSVLVAPSAGTSVQFQLIQADDAALTSNVQVINQTDAIPIATLTAGTLVPLHWDRAAPYTPKRYIGARYVPSGSIASMSVACLVVKDMQDAKNIYYKSGFSVT